MAKMTLRQRAEQLTPDFQLIPSWIGFLETLLNTRRLDSLDPDSLTIVRLEGFLRNCVMFSPTPAKPKTQTPLQELVHTAYRRTLHKRLTSHVCDDFFHHAYLLSREFGQNLSLSDCHARIARQLIKLFHIIAPKPVNEPTMTATVPASASSSDEQPAKDKEIVWLVSHMYAH